MPHPLLRLARAGLLPLCLLTFSAAAQAPLDIRVALVIGNAAYARAPLLNPVNDAKAMADTLRGLGFSVVELRDGTRAAMADAIERMQSSLKGKQAVGMLYYAGHGLQVDWRNFMVPVDATIATTGDVPAQAVDVGAVIEAFKSAGNRMNILVLDACRDNPFSGGASAKGLAPLDAPPGTFLAYATAPGNVAQDGDEATGNGLYTHFLLQELRKPTARIEDVFKRVRLQVRQKSQGRQIPWESTSLEDDFVFNTGIKPPPPPEVSDRERAFAVQKAEWDRIKDSPSADDVYDYLKRYPNGLITDLALARLEVLQKAQIKPQADRDGLSGQALDGLRDGDRYEFVLRDGLTGVERSRPTVRIRQTGPDLFEAVATGMAGSVANQAGFVFKDGSGTYDPPWNVLPGGEFVVGNRSSARSIVTSPSGERQWVDVDSRVIGKETLTLPFGTLQTYRVRVTMVFQNGVRRQMNLWYEPGWGYSLKFVMEIRNSRGLVDTVVREVTSRSRRG